MTDYEKYKQLLDSWSVAYYIEDTTISLRAKHDKIEGYCDFYCDAIFSDTGEFIKFGIWE